MVFALLATFPGWHEEYDARTGEDVDNKPFPSRPSSAFCCFALALASIFLLASALWQHVAAAAASSLTAAISQGFLQGSIGPTATALVWLSFALMTISFAGTLVIILSISVLDRLTDDY